MGEKFAFAYDVAIIVIALVFAFVGMKKGFAKVVLGLVSTIAAFACAMALSGPIAEGIYKKYVEAPIEEQLDNAANKALGDLSLGNIANISFDKVKINHVAAGSVQVDYAGTRKAVVDFSKLDLHETGITQNDLRKIGITDEKSLNNVNAKTAELSMDDIEKYGLGKLAVAQYIAVNLSQRSEIKAISGVADKISRYLPDMSKNASNEGVGVSVIRTVALKMFDTKGSFKDAAINGIIAPNCIMIFRTIAFAVIFFLVGIALRIVAAAADLINKIPVVNKVNSLLGLVLGLVEGIFAVFVVCLITRLIVSLTGANSILFNQAAIDSTFLFKTFYNFDFLNFLT